MQHNKLSHIDKEGNARMVDVSKKTETFRTATAEAFVVLGSEIISAIKENEINTKKGPVFQTAIIAGTQAVKRTADLIPMCHPLAIEKCEFQIKPFDVESIQIFCTVGITGKTGVEMEALTGAGIAALTIYDMCKAMSHHIEIRNMRLLSKSGGKSDFTR